MAARNVTCFVRDHTDNLFRMVRTHEKAGVNKQPLAARDEGVQCRVVDDLDPDITGLQTCHFENRCRVYADRILDLGIANKRNTPCRRLTGQRNQSKANHRPKNDDIHGYLNALQRVESP